MPQKFALQTENTCSFTKTLHSFVLRFYRFVVIKVTDEQGLEREDLAKAVYSDTPLMLLNEGFLYIVVRTCSLMLTITDTRQVVAKSRKSSTSSGVGVSTQTTPRPSQKS